MDRYQKEKLMDIRTFFLKGLSPQGGTFVIASIADVLAEGLTGEETVALASFLGSIGQLMGYIAAQTALNKSKKQMTITVDDKTITLTGV